MNMTRRQFVKRTAVAGAAVSLSWKFGTQSAYAFANSGNLRKWTQGLRGLGTGGIPILNGARDKAFANTLFYQVTAGEFTDQLHPGSSAHHPVGLLGHHQSR
jgi:spore coat protein A, manganese oxidase